MYSVSNFCVHQALFTTLPHKCAGMFVQRSRLCFIVPRWHVCRGVCLPACVLFVCAWYCSGGGFGGTGEINQSLAGKQPSCCPPITTPTLSLHAFDPSIVRWCTTSCGRLHPNWTQERHLLTEMKLKCPQIIERHIWVIYMISLKDQVPLLLRISVPFSHICHFREFWQSF